MCTTSTSKPRRLFTPLIVALATAALAAPAAQAAQEKFIAGHTDFPNALRVRDQRVAEVTALALPTLQGDGPTWSRRVAAGLATAVVLLFAAAAMLRISRRRLAV